MTEFPVKKMAAEFMAEKLNLRPSQDFQGTLFVPDEYRDQQCSMDHVGVCLSWDNFIGRTCTVSIVVQDKRCLTRRVVKAAFEYPFEKCGCEVVLALVDSNNLDSISLCHRVGFQTVSVLPKGGVEGDMVVFAMTKSACKWIKRSH